MSVCLSASILPNYTRDLYQIFVHVAYGRGSVLLRRGCAILRGRGNFGGFLPIDTASYGPYSGMNFARKDRFRLNLLIYRKVGQNSISYY